MRHIYWTQNLIVTGKSFIFSLVFKKFFFFVLAECFKEFPVMDGGLE